MKDLPYWLALNCVSVLGARRIGRLLHYCQGDAQAAFNLSENDLLEAGLPPKVVNIFITERKNIDPFRELKRCQSLGINVLTLKDENYPELLKVIHDPPPVLYYRGRLAVLNSIAVAVVGSRKATAYGKATAEKISGDLARAGVVIVSGMARGIDTSAHLGALKGQGQTVAVLGCGLDICYPPENKSLREKIVQSGAIVSEFPLGTPPKPAHFPRRNRILSGLSQAVVVVEAAQKSGALITADCALEQGRDVFAVPGSINSPYSKGCHKLLKEGAAVAENADDILQALGLQPARKAEDPGEISEQAAAVLAKLEYEPVHFDTIVTACGLSAAELAIVLIELELKGMIKKMPGNFFLRV
ncbi:MAG: DNA-protecting protein DprA [Firmicutes bacterium]|nr:DNA-protecting protein DprA [Bacillota bacterium]